MFQLLQKRSGKNHYQVSAEEQQNEFISVVDETLIKHAFKALENCGNQVFKAYDVIINENKNGIRFRSCNFHEGLSILWMFD